jgi:hypothetical protein
VLYRMLACSVSLASLTQQRRISAAYVNSVFNIELCIDAAMLSMAHLRSQCWQHCVCGRMYLRSMSALQLSVLYQHDCCGIWIMCWRLRRASLWAEIQALFAVRSSHSGSTVSKLLCALLAAARFPSIVGCYISTASVCCS